MNRIKNWFTKLFKRQKEQEYEYVPYVEKDTECDKCEYLHECLNKGFLINVTIIEDVRSHYIGALKAPCKKTVSTSWEEMWGGVIKDGTQN